MVKQSPPQYISRTWLAILPVLLAFALQDALWSLIQPYVWFLFYPAIFVSARIGGLRGGAIATLLATALVWWFFVPPAHVFNKHAINPLFSALVFVGMGLAISLLQQRLQQARQRARRALDRVNTANAELQSANQKITQLYEQAKQLDDLKTQFFSNVSHELRTPLALILGPAQQLLASGTLDAAKSRQLRVIERNAQTLLGHVNDLLDMSKLEAGQMPLHYAPVDLVRLITFVASHFEVQAQDKQMRFVLEHDEIVTAQVDTPKLQRVLFNLLSNAFKFTPDGGTVRVSLRAAEPVALIEVADSGPGIPADKRHLVFERFRQLDGGATRRHGGTGLGLAIASDFIALHAGKIEISEAPEGGALFRVSLPLQAPAGSKVASTGSALEPMAGGTPGEQAAPTLSASPQQPNGPLLLVIEDNPEMSHFICENLSDCYRLATAYDGQQGLQRALQLKPDLILCDVMLPTMSGDQLVPAIRAHAELDQTPIVLLSARTDDQLRIDLLRHGAQDYLTKPFSVDELRVRVGGLIARKQAEDALRESNQLLAYRAFLLANVSDAILATDKDYLITYWSPSAEAVYGWRAEEVLGRHSGQLLQSESSNGVSREQAFRILLEQGRFDGELRQTRKDGSKIIVQGAAIALKNSDGEFNGYVAISRDVTRQKQDETRLRQAAAVFDATNEGILVTDEQGNIVAVNRAFEQITGYASHEVFGRNPRLLQSGRQPQGFYEQLWQQLASTGQWQGEIWNQRKNGATFPAWENISAVRDSNGKVTHYIAVMSDISALKDAEQRLQHLAHHDPLTGLPNRRLFNISLEQALERCKRHHQKLGLLFLDLDRFKLINDTLGHAIGDQLLREVSGRLRHNVRAEDIVARLAGDEFTVILENIGQRDAILPLANKLIDALAAPMQLGDNAVRTSTSIGISLYPDDADNAAELVKAADYAMYRAKDQGRNSCEFYSANATSAAQQTLQLEQELHLALAEGQFLLHYQPQFDCRSQQISGLEALLRWQHPQRGLLLPQAFIQAAETSGLIVVIGNWVIGQVLQDSVDWQNAGLPPLRVGINLSLQQLLNPSICDMLESAIRNSPLTAERILIGLEMRETALQPVEQSVETLQRLHSLGLRIAIDNFGTGCSSLSNLMRLPIDTLKIDQLFIGKLPDNGDDGTIVKTMISMGHNLGLRVIAEGVETDAQLAFLQQHGCDEVQGFLFGQPQIAAHIAQRLQPFEQAKAGSQG